MPRYCAVKACRNRGGSAPRRRNKRVSFYPFPLQDQSRLQKWVDNMRREEWTPSRHQCLCSEHFTEDCFSIRWGIRYLKNTAVPTIFPAADDDTEKFHRVCNNVRSNAANPSFVGDTEKTDPFHVCVIEPPPATDAMNLRYSDSPDGQMAVSETPLHPCNGQSDFSVVVLSPSSVAALPAVLSQSFSFVPGETAKEESWAEENDGEHTCVCEHSYCRPDADKDQLWSRILSLHAKVLELDRREESTLAKIRALEAEITILKRDNAVFKEKQNVLEGFISSLFL